MSNGDTATLPIPTPGTPPFMPTQNDQQARMQQFLSLLRRLGPNPMNVSQQNLGQNQGQSQTPAIIPPILPPPGTKYDPTSTTGSLPTPLPQPERQGYQEPPFGAQLMQQLDPKAAATFTGIQGVSQFLQNTFQKKDQEKHAEAANAAQALMSALESAKTTGDFRPAEHILENNEQLFNKVYKGWLQKAEEAKKPKKQEKVDPEVAGFESALADYYKSQQPQGGQQQPQAPTTLMGKSGAKYMIPGAAPGQAIQQQQQSATMQQQRQAPGQPILSDEERRKLETQNYELQKVQLEVKKAEADLARSQNDISDVRTKYETQLKDADDKHQLALFNKDAMINELRTKLAAKQGQPKPKQPSEADVKKLNAIDQADSYLDDMIKKAKPFKENDVNALRAMLTTAGATSVVKLPANAWQRWMSSKDDVASFKENFDRYAESVKKAAGRGQEGTAAKDFGPAPEGKPDGATGTYDGTPFIVKNGRMVAQQSTQ